VLWQDFQVKVCVLEINCEEPNVILDLQHNHLDSSQTWPFLGNDSICEDLKLEAYFLGNH